MKIEIVIENLKTLELFNKKFDNISETISTAINALMKQKSIKVKRAYPFQRSAGYKHRCPVCNEAIGHLDINGILYELDCYYCSNCGQAIEIRPD